MREAVVAFGQPIQNAPNVSVALAAAAVARQAAKEAEDIAREMKMLLNEWKEKRIQRHLMLLSKVQMGDKDIQSREAFADRNVLTSSTLSSRSDEDGGEEPSALLPKEEESLGVAQSFCILKFRAKPRDRRKQQELEEPISFLGIVNSDNQLNVFDMDGKLVTVHDLGHDAAATIIKVEHSEDSQMLLSVDSNGLMRVHELSLFFRGRFMGGFRRHFVKQSDQELRRGETDLRIRAAATISFPGYSVPFAGLVSYRRTALLCVATISSAETDNIQMFIVRASSGVLVSSFDAPPSITRARGSIGALSVFRSVMAIAVDRHILFTTIPRVLHLGAGDTGGAESNKRIKAVRGVRESKKEIDDKDEHEEGRHTQGKDEPLLKQIEQGKDEQIEQGLTQADEQVGNEDDQDVLLERPDKKQSRDRGAFLPERCAIPSADGAVINALAFDVMFPKFLYAVSDRGEAFVFDTRGRGGKCKIIHKMGVGTVGGGGATILSTRGYLYVGTQLRFSVFNTTRVAKSGSPEFLFSKNLDLPKLAVGKWLPHLADFGDGPNAYISVPGSFGNVPFYETYRTLLPAPVRAEHDVSWLRIPLILFTVLLVVCFQVFRRKEVETNGRNELLSRRFEDYEQFLKARNRRRFAE